MRKLNILVWILAVIEIGLLGASAGLAAPIKPEEINRVLIAKGFSPDVAAKLAELVAENRREIAAGNLPAYLTRDIEEIPPITSRKDLAAIVVGGENLPEIAALPELTRANYAELVSRLYRTDELDAWYRNPDGSLPTAAQKEAYAKSQKLWGDDKQQALSKYDQKYGEAFVAEWFALYNRGAARMPVRARELYQRLLIDSWALAKYKFSPPPAREKLLSGMAKRGLGEYVLLSGGAATGGVAVLVRAEDTQQRQQSVEFRYLLVPEPAVAKAGIADIVTTADCLPGLTVGFALAKQIVQLDKERAESLKERARAEKSIAQAEYYTKLNISSRELSQRVEDLVKKYLSTPTPGLRAEIDREIVELEKLKQTIDTDPDKKRLEGVVAQYTVAMLYVNRYRQEIGAGK